MSVIIDMRESVTYRNDFLKSLVTSLQPMRNENVENVTVEFNFSNTSKMLLEKFAAKYNMMEEEFVKNIL